MALLSDTVTAPPPTCSVGDLYFLSNAVAGENLYGCTATNTWTLESTSSGVPAMAAQANKVLSTNSTVAQWRAVGGDVSGAPEAITVTPVQGTRSGHDGDGGRQVNRRPRAHVVEQQTRPDARRHHFKRIVAKCAAARGPRRP